MGPTEAVRCRSRRPGNDILSFDQRGEGLFRRKRGLGGEIRGAHLDPGEPHLAAVSQSKAPAAGNQGHAYSGPGRACRKRRAATLFGIRHSCCRKGNGGRKPGGASQHCTQLHAPAGRMHGTDGYGTRPGCLP